MNNKRIGTDFERELCAKLARAGYWVHFITPDARGAQPFDIIAAKGGEAYAIDCKTCAADIFNISRLEENQVLAFERWLACGNKAPILAVKHGETIYAIKYTTLKEKGKIRLISALEWRL